MQSLCRKNYLLLTNPHRQLGNKNTGWNNKALLVFKHRTTKQRAITDIASRILNLWTSWKWVLSFNFRLSRSIAALCVLRTKSGRGGEENKSLELTAMEPLLSNPPTATISRSRSRSSYIATGGQSVLVSSPNLGPMVRFLLLSDIWGLPVEGCPLWREDGSVIYSIQFAVTLRSKSHRTHYHILLSHLRPYVTVSYETLQPGGPGPGIYIPQEQGSPVIHPGTGFAFCRLLRLEGLRWKYSNLPPQGYPLHWLR
jgi:hypothetical protein